MTFEKVAKILADYKDMDVSEITMDSSFTDLKLDSLDTVEIIINLEDEFGVSIEMSEDFKTVGDIVALLDEAK